MNTPGPRTAAIQAGDSSAGRPLRRVLIVTPSFPPLNAPDMQRARMSLPHYRVFGWEPHVLAVEPAAHGGPREDALLKTIPGDVAVHRCGALSPARFRRLGIGNLGLRAWLHLFFSGAQLIRREKIDLVFLTNSQFLTFTLGRLWRAWLGVPYVIDLQDPWRTDFYERPGAGRPPGGWKYRFARLQASLLEGWSLRRAGAVMTVSARYLEDLRARYPWFRYVPTDVIRFGASETDLAIARTMPASPAEKLSAGTVRFVYTGAAGSIMEPALRVLFHALASFNQEKPGLAARLRFEFLGTSYAPAGHNLESVAPLAREFGVGHLVHERPGRLGHLECLRIQSDAGVLLLLGSSDPAYSPSKLYPYYLAARPMLGIVPHDSALEELLRELACATVVAFTGHASAGSAAAAESQLHSYFLHALDGFTASPAPPRNDPLFQREFLSPSLTVRQCRLFDVALDRERSDSR